ncbi:Vps45 [Ecytonucleospora hepatopenaei]|uniref:Vps45 n=1 Tax=Ecytonucleospora hepatopenaei TaxID=646526 RepID=A0A1W0E596_9MICR|nr:Vps45 [Ecytonucleospora hepatopenaei]
MDVLYAEQIDFVLNNLKDVKCILFDCDKTKQMINNSFNYKNLISSNYFYFDYLTNKKRSKINIHAVVILDGSNLKLWSMNLWIHVTQNIPFCLKMQLIHLLLKFWPGQTGKTLSRVFLKLT